MQSGKRFRAYPTPAQAKILLQWIGHQRFIDNAKISEDRYYRAFAKKAVSFSGTPVPVDQEYARFIGPETTWLREVPSPILRNGAVRWKQAMGPFFSGLARKPVFQRKDGRQSVWITSELFAFRDNEKTHASELGLGTKKFPVGVLSFTALPRIPIPPRSICPSRPASGTSHSPQTTAFRSQRRRRSRGSGCSRTRNSRAKPWASTGEWRFR